MKNSLIVFAVFILLLAGCGSPSKTTFNPENRNIKLSFLLDPGMEQIEESNQEGITQRHQLANFIEMDMKRLLTSAGYAPVVIKNKDEFDSSEGNYLLNMKISKYNPGNKAVRIAIGMGAGAVVMDTVTDFKNGEQVIFSKEQSIGSSRDWRHVVRKTNMLVIQDMSTHFSQLPVSEG